MAREDIVTGIVHLIRKAETTLPTDVVHALETAYRVERGLAKTQIATILKNIDISQKTQRPMCQDTGIQTFFVSLGVDSPYISQLSNIITLGVQRATKEVPLRPNTVNPLTDENQLDNTGYYIPHIMWELVQGDEVGITALPKGGGSENMSKLGMLNPTDGLQGIKDFVTQEVINGGGKPCPPTIVGVGIGGGADLALQLAKKALLRPIGQKHDNTVVAALEEAIISRINASGIGPMGLGGKTTVLDVQIEVAHRHPASFPIGISVQCWASRRATMVIHPDGDWDVE